MTRKLAKKLKKSMHQNIQSDGQAWALNQGQTVDQPGQIEVLTRQAS